MLYLLVYVSRLLLNSDLRQGCPNHLAFSKPFILKSCLHQFADLQPQLLLGKLLTRVQNALLLWHDRIQNLEVLLTDAKQTVVQVGKVSDQACSDCLLNGIKRDEVA